MPRKKQRASYKFLPLSDLPTNVPPFLKTRLAKCTTAKPQEPEVKKLILLDRIIIFSQMLRDRWYSKPLKLKLQKWWDCALHQIRDFWRDLEHQKLSALSQHRQPT